MGNQLMKKMLINRQVSVSFGKDAFEAVITYFIPSYEVPKDVVREDPRATSQETMAIVENLGSWEGDRVIVQKPDGSVSMHTFLPEYVRLIPPNASEMEKISKQIDEENQALREQFALQSFLHMATMSILDAASRSSRSTILNIPKWRAPGPDEKPFPQDIIKKGFDALEKSGYVVSLDHHRVGWDGVKLLEPRKSGEIWSFGKHSFQLHICYVIHACAVHQSKTGENSLVIAKDLFNMDLQHMGSNQAAALLGNLEVFGILGFEKDGSYSLKWEKLLFHRDSPSTLAALVIAELVPLISAAKSMYGNSVVIDLTRMDITTNISGIDKAIPFIKQALDNILGAEDNSEYSVIRVDNGSHSFNLEVHINV